jgi:hypothetical protein
VDSTDDVGSGQNRRSKSLPATSGLAPSTDIISPVRVGPVGARSERSQERQMQHSQAAKHLPCLANDDGKLPDGQITKSLSSPSRKNIPLNPSGKSPLQARPVPPDKGADRESSRTRGGMRWTRQRRARRGSQGGSCRERSDGARTNDAANRLCQNSPRARGTAGSLAWTGADGEVVWSWRPDAGVKSGGDASGPTRFGMYRQSARRRWQTSRSPGRARSKP